MIELVIVGAGGFAREVLEWARSGLQAEDVSIKGFLSPKMHDLDEFDTGGLRILGDERDYDIRPNDRFVLALGDLDIRKRVTSTLQANGAQFMTLIHPSAIVARTASIGNGTVVCPFALVGPDSTIGDFSLLNFYASCAHDVQIGKFSTLSPYATANGFAVLEDEVFMGTHSTVVAGKRIGRRSKISANSVAMANVPAGSLVVGVPGQHRVIFPS